MQRQIEVAKQFLGGTGDWKMQGDDWGRGWSEVWGRMVRARPP